MLYKKRGVFVVIMGVVMLVLAISYMVLTFYVPQVGPIGERKVSGLSWVLLVILFLQAVIWIPYGIVLMIRKESRTFE